METGIVGLPLSGKTALFNLLTRSEAETGFAAGKKKVNIGISRVPDPRLDRLSEIWRPKKTTHATIQYVDVAGVERGSGKEGLAPDLLTSLRNTDALVAVLRAFENAEVPHPEGSIDPSRDLATLQTELLFGDLVTVENRLQRIEKLMKGKGEKSLEAEKALMERCLEFLEAERPLRDLPFSPEEQRVLKGFQFLTQKPLIIAVNLGESDIANAAERIAPLEECWGGPTVTTTYLCATIEREIAQLAPEDADAFLEDLGIESPATDRIIRATYELLGLISFFTVGENECRAWTIRRGTKALQAAGTVHTDMERGFIRAEVVNYDEFMAAGSMAACREKGILRLEGKEYAVRDGDILTVRFNV